MKALLKNAALVAALMSISVNAGTIYDNTQADLEVRFNPGLLEVGDELVFSGSERTLSAFSFEYWGTSLTPGVFAGNVEARVRFYANDGAPFNGYASPSTVLYDSQWFSIAPTDRATLAFAPGADNVPADLVLPENMTFSVQFQGMGAGDAAGVDLYGPPSMGSSYADYWQFDGLAWSLKENPAGAVNFALEIQAVPEPSVLALLVAGGALLFARRLR